MWSIIISDSALRDVLQMFWQYMMPALLTSTSTSQPSAAFATSDAAS